MIDTFNPYLARWSLTPDGIPFETPSSWLCFVARAGGHAVLKVHKPGSDEGPGARYLALHAGHGAVRVLEADSDAVLIERAVPGTRLRELALAGRDDEATHIVCDTIEKLQSAGADPHDWPGHEAHTTEYAHAFETPLLSRHVVDAARGLFHDLTQSQTNIVLLHGDLHHENILFDDARGWLAIDPKGVAGEIAYELAAPLRNPIERPDLFATPAAMDHRVAIYCERLGLDRRRVLGWCLARNCVAALWNMRCRPQSDQGPAFAAATLAAYELLQS
jgi:streptomycin 6-kinase